MQYFKHGQKGFTLIELLVAIPIAALVMLATGGVILQVIQSGRATAQMTAIRQVQNAGRWISQDGLQSESTCIPPFGDCPGILCRFVWTDPDTVLLHSVVYRLVPMGSGSLQKLEREETIGVGGAPLTRIVAYNLDGAVCSVAWKAPPANSTFVLTVRATVGLKTEDRKYEVTPRPGQRE